MIQWIRNHISGTRKRESHEITPIDAKHSATEDDNEVGYAVDRNIFSRSHTAAGSDGKIWLTITLDHMNCVQRVMRNIFDGNVYENPYQTWICNRDGCNNCNSAYCSHFTLTVSVSGSAFGDVDIPEFTDCKIGDTVILEKTSSFYTNELVIIGYEGKIQ